MQTQASPPPDVDRPGAVYLPWDKYLGWLAGKVSKAPTATQGTVELGPPLAPGQHMPVIGPTGCAKLPPTP